MTAPVTLGGTVHRCPVHGETAEPLWLGPAEEAYPYCRHEDCTLRLKRVRGAFRDMPKTSEWQRTHGSIARAEKRPGSPHKHAASPPPAVERQDDPGEGTKVALVLALVREGIERPTDILAASKARGRAISQNALGGNLRYLQLRGLVVSPKRGVWRAVK